MVRCWLNSMRAKSFPSSSRMATKWERVFLCKRLRLRERIMTTSPSSFIRTRCLCMILGQHTWLRAYLFGRYTIQYCLPTTLCRQPPPIWAKLSFPDSLKHVLPKETTLFMTRDEFPWIIIPKVRSVYKHNSVGSFLKSCRHLKRRLMRH